MQCRLFRKGYGIVAIVVEVGTVGRVYDRNFFTRIPER